MCRQPESPFAFAAMVLVAQCCVSPLALGQSPSEKPPEQRATPTPEELKEFAKLAEPGPEHERLSALEGKWSVALRRPGKTDAAAVDVGRADVRPILGGRFVDVTLTVEKGPMRSQQRHTLGFDRRHGEFTTTVADTTGTYAVSARGKADAAKPDEITMHGEDDDPLMKQMGYEKKFQFILRFAGEDEFSIETVFVDTRTKENKAIPFVTYVFRRAAE